MRDLFYVMAAFAAIYLLFSGLLQSPPPQLVVSPQGTRVTLYADRSGHFRGDGSINGVAVEFLVDTGASYLSLPESLANRLGLKGALADSPRVLLETAAGQVAAYRTLVEVVRFSGIEQHHVAAVVVPGLAQPLLGMNFLKHLEIQQRDGEMVLQQHR